MNSLSKIAASRLERVSGHVHGEFAEEMLQLAIRHLLNGTGSEKGCLSGLESHARGKAIYVWFAEGDLEDSKAWFATAAWLQERRLRLIDRAHWLGATNTFGVLDAVCIDDVSIRSSVGLVTESLHRHVDKDPLAFISRQIGLFLRGRIGAASEAIAEFVRNFDPRASSSLFSPDVEVFRAIHHGSDKQVKASLKRICEISSKPWRSELEDGFTDGLLSTPATIYLRLCWAAGREIHVDDDLIPMEWMSKGFVSPEFFKFPALLPYVLRNYM